MERADAETASVQFLLRQRRWWREFDGALHERKDMTLAHKLAVMSWLEQHGSTIEQDVHPVSSERSSVEWVRSAPLYRAYLEDVIFETTRLTRSQAGQVVRSEESANRRRDKGQQRQRSLGV